MDKSPESDDVIVTFHTNLTATRTRTRTRLKSKPLYQLIIVDPENVKDEYSPHLNQFRVIFMYRLKHRDINFCDLALLNLRQGIVG